MLPKPTDLVQAEEVIAVQRNIFGEVICQYRAHYDGIVIGKSMNPVAQTGSRIVHLGAIAAPDEPNFRVQAEAITPQVPTLEHLAVH
ncbi:MAG: hypothetical protein HC800_05245 [Phormidesmis sp. RL_2_1]|nr:hypothetical protein [Phormidesmis sp. RL_2_1]